MSYLTYLASDAPLEAVPEPENLEIFMENGRSRTEPENWLAVLPFDPARMDSVFTEKPFAAELRWEGSSERKAALLQEYLARQAPGEIEFWNIWMCGMSRPYIKTRTLSLPELTAEELERIEACDPCADTVGGRDLYDDDALPVQRRLILRRERENRKGSV